MSIVIKTTVLSDEDTTFYSTIKIMRLNKDIPCKRVLETIDDIDASTSESHSSYIFNMADAEVVKEILLRCIENTSFKVHNITIETRINKFDVIPTLDKQI